MTYRYTVDICSFINSIILIRSFYVGFCENDVPVLGIDFWAKSFYSRIQFHPRTEHLAILLSARTGHPIPVSFLIFHEFLIMVHIYVHKYAPMEIGMSRKRLHIHQESTPFICENCGLTVVPPESGTMHRNHCPHCLYSRHVDMRIGDRRSGCRGLMEPIGIWVPARKDWSIIHRCTKCGFIRTNRIAGDDNEMLLLSLAARPMTQLPFPVEMVFENFRRVTVSGDEK